MQVKSFMVDWLSIALNGNPSQSYYGAPPAIWDHAVLPVVVMVVVIPVTNSSGTYTAYMYME